MKNLRRIPVTILTPIVFAIALAAIARAATPVRITGADCRYLERHVADAGVAFVARFASTRTHTVRGICVSLRTVYRMC